MLVKIILTQTLDCLQENNTKLMKLKLNEDVTTFLRMQSKNILICQTVSVNPLKVLHTQIHLNMYFFQKHL